MATTQVAKRHRRMYDVDQRAMMLAVLDANHGNVRATAAQFNIRDSTLRGIIRDAERDTKRAERVRALRAAKREDIADSSVDAAWEALVVARDKLPEASARDAAVCFGIFVDKAQLLRGLPTQVHGQAAHPVLSRLSAEQLRAVRAALATVVVDSGVSPGETVETDAQCAGDARGTLQGGGAGAGEQPTDGTLGETRALG